MYVILFYSPADAQCNLVRLRKSLPKKSNVCHRAIYDFFRWLAETHRRDPHFNSEKRMLVNKTRRNSVKETIGNTVHSTKTVIKSVTNVEQGSC